MNQLEFFKKLSNTNDDIIDIAKLTSAQQARFISWSKENGFKIDIAQSSSINTFDKIDNSNTEINHEIKIGVDIQSIKELFPYMPEDLKSDDQFTNIFTIKEISYAETKKNPLQTLTGIFCAKEAIIKSNYYVNDLNKIEIAHDKNKPFFKDLKLSISHSKDYAIAVALFAPNKKINKLDNLEINEISQKNSSNKKYLNLFFLNLITTIFLIFIFSFFNF